MCRIGGDLVESRLILLGGLPTNYTSTNRIIIISEVLPKEQGSEPYTGLPSPGVCTGRPAPEHLASKASKA